MFLIVGIFLSGIIIGFLLRRFPRINIISGKLSHILVILLLFFLGFSVGKNELIMKNIAYIGWHSLLISVFAMAGSISVLILYLKIRKK